MFTFTDGKNVKSGMNRKRRKNFYGSDTILYNTKTMDTFVKTHRRVQNQK